MKKQLPFFSVDFDRTQIKENVSIYKNSESNEKFILKGRRKREKNYLDKLRFRNEKRIYEAFRKGNFNYLKIPAIRVQTDPDSLILEYIEEGEKKQIHPKDFVSAYFELQNLNPKKDFLLDLYNQVFRAYFYRVCIVSAYTLLKKTNFTLAYNSILLFLKLNLKQPRLEHTYWQHGDLNPDNFFYNKRGELHFIDFENMFFTRKWPVAEIIRKSFKVQKNTALFSNNLFQAYFQNLNPDSELKQLSFYNQFRFAILHHSIHEIAQTKDKAKKIAYRKLLKMVLSSKDFKEWYHSNVCGRVQNIY